MKKTLNIKFSKRAVNILLAAFMALWQLAVPTSAFAIQTVGGPAGQSAPVSDNGIIPTLYEAGSDYSGGNVTCSQLGYDSSSTRNNYSNGFSDTWPNGISVTTDGTYVDWTSSFGISAVIVKGGPNANVYEYSPASTGDNDLASPINNSDPYGLSNLTFCWDKLETGSLKVSKKVDLGNGYIDDNPSNYGFVWGYGGDTPSRLMGNTVVDLPVGEYTVTENDVVGYEFTGWYYSTSSKYSCDKPSGNTTDPITVSVKDGQTRNVTLCNKKVTPTRGQIKVTKETLPAGSNKKFKITATGDGAIDGNAKRKIKDGQTITYNVDFGTYKVTEKDYKNWDEDDSDCEQLIVNANNPVAECTITNTKQASISGFKFNDLYENGNYDPNKGETKLSGWTIFIDENSDGVLDLGETSTVTDNDGNYMFNNLPAGEDQIYRVCEVQQPGWEQTWPVANNGCHVIELDKSEVVKKVKFGNREKEDDDNGGGDGRGKITIIKDAKPNDAQDFHFNVDEETICPQLQFVALSAVNCYSQLPGFDLDDDSDSKLSNTEELDLPLGVYKITEEQVTGWELEDIECDTEILEIGADYAKIELHRKGQEVTCTFTNVKDEVPEVPGVPQVLGSVTEKKEQPQVLAVTGESYDWRGSAMAVTLAGAALVTASTRRKETEK